MRKKNIFNGPTVKRLLLRMKTELNIDLPDDARVERTRAGRNQRSSGAWSWHLVSEKDWKICRYGSPYSITELLKAKKLLTHYYNFGDTEILPE